MKVLLPMIKYTACFDQSGYGFSATNTCTALINAGFDVTTNILTTNMTRQEATQTPIYQEIYKRALNTKREQIYITEQVPILWDRGFQKGAYCVGRLYWETDKVSPNWVNIINDGLCNEVWVSCEWNKKACINSGIKKPVYIIPPVSKFNVIDKATAQQVLTIQGNPEAYRFYSIFQWTKRKNGDGLLRSYFNEFTADDNVLLVLKSYGISNHVMDKRIIKETILELKEKSNNPNPPPVFFVSEFLSPLEINALNAQCHCYVNTARGEGWSLPVNEAMAYGNQVVSPKLGGITDMLDDTCAYVIPHTWEAVTGMPWGSFYNENMKWGKLEDTDIQKAMRKAYNERNNFKRPAKYNDILDSISEDNVVALIRERINKIMDGMNG